MERNKGIGLREQLKRDYVVYTGYSGYKQLMDVMEILLWEMTLDSSDIENKDILRQMINSDDKENFELAKAILEQYDSRNI